MQLTSIEPKEATTIYLRNREYELANETLTNYRYRLKRFTEWAESEGIKDLSELTGRKCEEYKQSRRRNGDLTFLSLREQIRTFRAFVRFAEKQEWVPPRTSQKIILPKQSGSDPTRDVQLTPERADEVLAYLRKYEYASVRHVVLEVLWHTSVRVGSAVALDLIDWASEGPSDEGTHYLTLRHRPPETPLKLKEKGERHITISKPTVVEALNDYVAEKRKDKTDDKGREPLFTSRNGRMARSTIQHFVYAVTRPCYVGTECPVGKDPNECEHNSRDGSVTCPDSVSPHPIRRGSITHALNNEVPPEVVSERAAVSLSVLEKHYDVRTQEDKRRNRERFLSGI